MIEYLDRIPIKEPLIFDSHAHYDDARFDQCRDELLTKLSSHGVGGIINCGCDAKSSIKALDMANEYDFVFAAVGIHPSNLDSGTTLAQIEELSKNKKCVAIGEIGLDYYWTQDNKSLQKEIFTAQLKLSEKLGFPIIVHDRDAHEDTLNLLREYRPKGVVHSFSGSAEMAEEILKLGMYIGIGGVITFKNARKLPDIVKMLPEDKILLETDAPYLTPEPYRSKTNHSAMIYLTAQRIAEIRGTDTKNILSVAFENAKKLFSI